ncbi:hypothetical protein MNBD_UNCLBAC01-668 [hydrothermal vent metagenome]|uniref:Glycosyltransferase RgtA/B/C/D-like domain-containing protein n=1 Tax=hydrothermal vent metagenome TaxID=652676 RepID=A0A3B1DHU6_9ZZZZ
MKIFKLIILLILPVIVTIISVMMKDAAGPYWLGVNSDPAYLYLVNSVYLIDGIVPYFTDHPGTTLQWLGVFVIKALSGNISATQMVDNVFTNPERYLHATHYVMLTLYIVTLLALGFYALRKTKNILIALLIQTSSLFFLTLKSYIGGYVLPVVVNINSDTLIMPIANLYVMCVLKLFYDKKPSQYLYSAILFGIICGLGVTTKLTFLPLLLLPIILLPQWRFRVIFAGVFLMTGGVIISTVMSRYREIFHWIQHISLERSSEGKVVAIMKLGIYLQALKGLLIAHWPLTLLIVICVAALVKKFFFSKEGERNFLYRRQTSFISVFILMLIAQFIMVSRHAGPHYMSPAFSLFGVILGFMYLGWNAEQNKKIKYTSIFLVVLTVGFTSYALVYQKKLKQVNQDIYNFSNRIYNEYGEECIVFGFYRSSSLPMAIRFAQGHGNFKHYAKVLKEKYPEALFFNPWHRVFSNFDKNVMLRQVVPSSGCMLMYGSAASFEGSDYLKVEKMEQVHGEKLYRIKFTTLDKAHKYYLIAMVLEEEEIYIKRPTFMHFNRSILVVRGLMSMQSD